MKAKATPGTRPAAGPVEARFFRSSGAFRRWLERHHAAATELWIGFHRKGTGKKGLSYAEAVDVALCFGWIDGIRKRRDDTTYVNRFTPRKPGSIWSLVNIRHIERLTAAGLMHPAGIAAFERRDPARTGVYSFETRPQQFPPAYEARFQAKARAWAHFSAQPPGYQRLAIWYVVSAKREETQDTRLQRVIDAHRQGLRLGVLFGQTGPASAKATAGKPAPKAPGPQAPKTPGPQAPKPSGPRR